MAATDGVGTKLRIAIDTGNVDGVGIDLVAMCVNDLVCQGAEPLFFLDYFATGKLETRQAARIIEGIAEGCELSGCALIGGETAEMPGMYPAGDFDLAGFAVGAMERGAELPAVWPRAMSCWGWPATACIPTATAWCARWSRCRAWLGRCLPLGEGTLGEALLTPTRLYVKPALAAMRAGGVHALAHITGGGLTENLPRVLPEGLGARDRPGRMGSAAGLWLARGQGGMDRRAAQDLQLRDRHGRCGRARQAEALAALLASRARRFAAWAVSRARASATAARCVDEAGRHPDFGRRLEHGRAGR